MERVPRATRRELTNPSRRLREKPGPAQRALGFFRVLSGAKWSCLEPSGKTAADTTPGPIGNQGPCITAACVPANPLLVPLAPIPAAPALPVVTPARVVAEGVLAPLIVGAVPVHTTPAEIPPAPPPPRPPLPPVPPLPPWQALPPKPLPWPPPVWPVCPAAPFPPLPALVADSVQDSRSIAD